MNGRRDEEYDEDDRPDGAIAEVSSNPVQARDDFPEDHLDYTKCPECKRRYRSGDPHTCPQ